MLIQIALIYAATLLVALCGAVAVEAVRLNTTGAIAPALDRAGCLCVAWLVAPVAGPAWACVAIWGWLRRKPRSAPAEP